MSQTSGNLFPYPLLFINFSSKVLSIILVLAPVSNIILFIDILCNRNANISILVLKLSRINQRLFFRRALSNNVEDYGFLGVQAIEAIFMSLMIGIVFFDLAFDQISVRDRFGLLYIVGALYPYMVILDVIGQCKDFKVG